MEFVFLLKNIYDRLYKPVGEEWMMDSMYNEAL